MEKKNILWINYVKAICMLCVFLTHSMAYYGFSVAHISSFVAPFFVNAFFFISGYLLLRKQLSCPVIDEPFRQYVSEGGKKLLSNIFFCLIVPTILFSIIEFFPSFLLRGREVGIVQFLKKTIGGGTYWFTSALAVGEILLLLILLTRKKKILFYAGCCVVLFAAGELLCTHKDIDLPNYWCLRQALLAEVFLGLGGLYWKCEAYMKKLSSVKLGIVLWITYFVSVILLDSRCRVTISLLDMNVLGVLVSLIGILALIKICELPGRISWLDYIGKNTITFYFMSGALPIVLSTVVGKLFPTPTFIGMMLVFVCSVSLAFIATMLINRYLPFLLDLRVLKNRQ